MNRMSANTPVVGMQFFIKKEVYIVLTCVPKTSDYIYIYLFRLFFGETTSLKPKSLESLVVESGAGEAGTSS